MTDTTTTQASPTASPAVKDLHDTIATLVNKAANSEGPDHVEVIDVATILIVMACDATKTLGLEPSAMIAAFARMALMVSGAPLEPTIPVMFAQLVDGLADEGHPEAREIRRQAALSRAAAAAVKR